MNLKKRARGIARAGRTIIRNAGLRVRYAGGFSREDRELFDVELNAWRPQGEAPTTYLRWIMTEWCNFNCAYCDQIHPRRATKPGGFTNHCFDNFPVERWMRQFEYHFSKQRLALVLTGGEPMLDAKNVNTFLEFLTAAPWVSSIRIDTNASWTPNKYKALDKSKITLNTSFHPTQIKEDKYFANLESILDAGFKIGFVTYVYNRDQRVEYTRIREKIEALGLLVNASPEFKERSTFDANELRDIRLETIENDYRLRMELDTPKGKRCVYPTFAYEMDQTGYLKVGCMYSFTGSFFDPELPFFGKRSAVCPHNVCGCLDKYSFLEGFSRNNTTDPFEIYCGKLRDLSKKRRGAQPAPMGADAT